jgi:hypothetical protein
VWTVLLILPLLGTANAQVGISGDQILTLAWSPDGTRLAVGGGPNSCLETSEPFGIEILDVTTGNVIHELVQHTCPVYSVAWSPDGTRLVSGSSDGTTVVWNVSTGQLVFQTPSVWAAAMTSLSWSPDNTQYAGIASPSVAYIWNAATGELENSGDYFDGGSFDRVLSLDWSRNGNRIAVGGWTTPDINIWHADTLVLERTLTGHTEGVYSVRWSQDSSKLASADRAGGIIIWSAAGQLLEQFNAGNQVYEINWSPDGAYVATAQDNGVVVWDIETGSAVQSYPASGRVYAVAWSPDGTRLVYGDNAYPQDGQIEFETTNFATTLITNITAANGKAYARDVLNLGSAVYIDRTYTYTALPPELTGRDYIMTAILDRQLTTIDFLTFTLTADAEVYVLWDSRFVIPNWLRGWTNTGLTVTTTDFNNTTLNRFVYRRFYPRGTVVLGANRSTNSSVTYSVAAVPRTVNVIYRIDAGGGGYTSPSGVVWQADAHFTGGQANSFPTAVQNTADDALYTTERSSVSDTTGFSYALPVTNGTYTVRLHFAEIWFVGGSGREPSGSGQRVFDVQIEGVTVLDNFDITASVGHAAATVRTFEGITVSDGALNLNFPPATADRPTIEAIEVWRE